MTGGEHDWRRAATHTSLQGRTIEVCCEPDVVDTLFYADDGMPLANPSGAVTDALSYYWRHLETTGEIFSGEEWLLLASFSSPFFRGESRFRTAKEAANTYRKEHLGRNWCDEVLLLKRLMKEKFQHLSRVEYEAVLRILHILGNLYSHEPFFTLSEKIPALRPAVKQSPAVPSGVSSRSPQGW
ncbi:hypothetical protein GCM10009099_42900 [Caenispirillum bisanense]